MKDVIIYTHNWFLSRSDSYRQILFDTLDYANIKYKIKTHQEYIEPEYNKNIFYLLYVPDQHYKYKNNTNKYFVLPMYDWFFRKEKPYMDNVSKMWDNINVLTLSNSLSEKLKLYNQPCVNFKFFPIINDNLKISQTDSNILFYWNRSGLYSEKFLKQICKNFKINKFFYFERLDEGNSESIQKTLSICDEFEGIELEKFIFKTKENIRDIYLDIIKRCNIFLSPRFAEGVGLSFLEYMSMGGYIIGYDYSSLNEYISHNENGYLLNNDNNYEYQQNEQLNEFSSISIDYNKCIDNITNFKLGRLKFLNEFINYLYNNLL